jgi:hypothetical protein
MAVLALPGCASVILQPVDFSWSFESVLTADENGMVRGEPKTLAFDAGGLYRAETGERRAPADMTVRVIRDADGYYFMTSAGFKNVYVLKAEEGKMVLKKKVLIDEQGIDKPYFNRREQGIELGANGRVYLLSSKGIVSGGKK